MKFSLSLLQKLCKKKRNQFLNTLLQLGHRNVLVKKKKNTLPISPSLLLNRAIDLFDRQDLLLPWSFIRHSFSPSSSILDCDRTNNLWSSIIQLKKVNFSFARPRNKSNLILSKPPSHCIRCSLFEKVSIAFKDRPRTLLLASSKTPLRGWIRERIYSNRTSHWSVAVATWKPGIKSVHQAPLRLKPS